VSGQEISTACAGRGGKTCFPVAEVALIQGVTHIEYSSPFLTFFNNATASSEYL
jgi:hypothetical protein